MAPRELVLGVCRIARDSAKVEDQVRLLARTLNKTLEPDGPATGCNPVQVGSTPTGVSDHPTAGLDYILLRRVRTISSSEGHCTCSTACRDYIQARNLVLKAPSR